MALTKVMYTTKVTVTGGRDGEAVSADGLLKVKLGKSKEIGGGGGATNPEQLFAAGYAACFLSAMQLAASKKKTTMSENASITAEVSLGMLGESLALAVVMHVNLPGMDKAQADQIVELAHTICPYSNATRGNIEVRFEVTT